MVVSSMKGRIFVKFAAFAFAYFYYYFTGNSDSCCK